MKFLSRDPVFFCAKGFRLKDWTTVNSKSAVPEPSQPENKNQETPSALSPSIESIDYGTTAQLFEDICSFLRQHPGLTMESTLKLTYFLIAILFSEHAEIWPIFLVVAPDTTGSSLLLRMIACVSSSVLHIGEVTLNALLTLPLASRPTLLMIDQLAADQSLEHLLRIMSRPGGHILHKGNCYDVSLPTLVCTGEPLRDGWILVQAIQIFLTPNRSRLLRLDSESLSESARKLQGKLARYREVNLTKVRDSLFDVPEFRSPVREIASWLGRCIVDDPELQRRVVLMLEPENEDVRVRRMDSIEAVVTEAVLFLYHEGKSQALVGEITTIANGVLKGRGERVELEPRGVGNYLRALDLCTKRLGAAGRGIRFNKEIGKAIHELAETFEARSFKSSCELCANKRSRGGKPPDRGS